MMMGWVEEWPRERLRRRERDRRGCVGRERREGDGLRLPEMRGGEMALP